MRVLAALVAGVVGVGLLAGCGDDEEGQRDAYCDALRAEQPTFGEMASREDPAYFVEQRPMLERLGKQAPADLTDEWQTFLNALKGLDEALQAANVEPGEFGPGKVPDDLTVADAKKISDAADVLASEEVVAAANGIEQQARDVCLVQLGL